MIGVYLALVFGEIEFLVVSARVKEADVLAVVGDKEHKVPAFGEKPRFDADDDLTALLECLDDLVNRI